MSHCNQRGIRIVLGESKSVNGAEKEDELNDSKIAEALNIYLKSVSNRKKIKIKYQNIV